MNKLFLQTDGSPVQKSAAILRTHPILNVEMAHIEITVGDTEVVISVDSCKDMIDFCEKHNFHYDDQREPLRAAG